MISVTGTFSLGVQIYDFSISWICVCILVFAQYINFTKDIWRIIFGKMPLFEEKQSPMSTLGVLVNLALDIYWEKLSTAN